ncbi:MAG: putative glycoside hydrolase, partial [Acidimicrobiia bacterium]
RVTTGSDGWFSFEIRTPTTMSVSKPGWSSVELEWDEATTYYEPVIAPRKVRGIRVSASAAADDAAFSSLLDLAAGTAIDAFVFDTKQEGGKVLYDTSVSDAHDMGAVDAQYDPGERLEQAHSSGIYTITRIVAFEDAERVASFADEKLAGPWIDPRSVTGRGYLLALAEEACALGFDEVMFDYVRYPSGRTATVTGQLDMEQSERVGVIAGFLADARDVLHPMGCAVSAAIFGIVTSTEDDQGLGQRPEELSAQVDVLSPMIYPSHYSDGWLGLEDPNQHPYDVTTDAIGGALARMEPTSVLRPWLQSFWWTNEEIRRSIQAAEDLGTGWLLWNVRSNFDAAAIPTEGEVSP